MDKEIKVMLSASAVYILATFIIAA